MPDEPGSTVTIRRAESPADYAACQDAQRRAWGLDDEGYVVPIATLVGANRHGGLVLGAFLPDGRAAGLSFGFLGRIGGDLGLYSQLAGVVPEFQGRGLGRRLKQSQFDFAVSQGLDRVAWAFDPMQGGNARFNLDTLGAAAEHYHVDMYGPRTDPLNLGIPTDRLLAIWRPDRPPRPPLPGEPFEVLPALIAPEGPAALPPHPSAPTALLEIPADPAALRALPIAHAERWRTAVREAFQAAFAAGFRAVATARSDREPHRLAYVLHRAPR